MKRIDKINAEIQRVMSELVAGGYIKDPRMQGFASVIRTDTTSDLSYCKVFVSIYGSEEQKKNTMLALKSASSFLRSELARRVSLRITPELVFIQDDSIEYSIKLDKILKDIKD
ncbi:MAG: 30S ribosome-binding factor RbfA [Clostridia bacterium]|nr:30S ribosome-binding factor RbfA [Clostridia bacterium]